MLSLVFPIFCINVFVTFAVITLKAYLNFTRIRFESFFRGCFSVFTRRIAGYLTRENREKDRKRTQKRPDSIFLLENLNRLLIPLKKINFSA